MRGAAAAFSSVLRRAPDDETRARAAYNLGNAAFKQDDFASAVAHYTRAAALNPDHADTRYNLELALRELEKQKEDRREEQKQESGEGGEKDKEQTREQKQGKGDDSKSGEGKESSETGKEQRDGKDSSEARQGEEQDKTQQGGASSPRDLSGELKASGEMPEAKSESPEDSAVAIDRQKAEALLDNITEDRTKFLRFRIPEGKKHGVASGKDW